jgi:hypothetical protein
MFTTNLFAKASHPALSAASISDMSVADIVALTKSSYSMSELASDSAARQAALAKLSAAYGSSADSASAQAAAMAAATIIIQTDPDAAQFSASAISLITTLPFSSSTTPTDVVTAIIGALPPDISSQISPGSQPPAAFVQMVADFESSNSTFEALSAGLTATGGTYADASVGADQRMAMASDGAISALISDVQPTNGQSTADALWAAICDPSTASSELSVDPGAISSSTGSLAGLLAAAGLTLPGSSS